MAESGCAPSLTAAEDIDAQQYVQATSAAVSRLRHAVRGGGRRVRARLADGLSGRELREPDHRGGQRGGAADARPSARRRPRLRHHAVGHRRARRPPCTSSRRPRPSVPMPYGALVQWHRRTQVCGPATPSPTMPFDITGLPAVPERLGRAADAVPVHGVAGPGGGRAAGHSAARHPDRGGGHDAASGTSRLRRKDEAAAASIPPQRLIRLGRAPSVAWCHGGIPRCDAAAPGVGPGRAPARAPATAVVAGRARHGRSRSCCRWRPTPPWWPSGQGCSPSTKGYVHFAFADYAKLTIVGVLIACAAWPVVARLSSAPRWLFFRLAIVVTLVLFCPTSTSGTRASRLRPWRC